MTTTTETLTPAAVAALPDAELNELAAQIVMGWHRRDYAWADSKGKRTEYCNPDYTHQWSSDSHYRIFRPASHDEHAFVLVDALQSTPSKQVEYSLSRQTGTKWKMYICVLRPIAVDKHEYLARTEAQHASRARAITEAAVLAAMAMKEGK